MMQYLIVSDVFGRTNALDKIVSELSVSADFYDPYNSRNMDFKNETEAYNYFITHVGLDKYAKDLRRIIRSYSEPLCIIGFSVGASAIWRISFNEDLKHITRAYCFYGSQIRHNKDIQPIFPVQLICPVSEEHFSVSDLIIVLSNRKNVDIVETTFLHGFMNSHSENYSQSAYQQFIQVLSSN